MGWRCARPESIRGWRGAQGVSTERQTLVGMALSSGLVALAGALFAQSRGGADISMGVGTIVAGLAAVIIGETLLPSRYLAWVTASCVLGAVLYRFLVVLALNTDGSESRRKT